MAGPFQKSNEVLSMLSPKQHGWALFYAYRVAQPSEEQGYQHHFQWGSGLEATCISLPGLSTVPLCSIAQGRFLCERVGV
jgi:hypothetical protein